MDQEIIEILKEIKTEEHLAILLPKKIANPLIKLETSLLDILELSEDEFAKVEGLGITKFVHLQEFKEEIERHPELIEKFKKYVLDTEVLIPNQIDDSKSLATNLFQSVVEYTAILEGKLNCPATFFNKVDYNAFSFLLNYISDYYGLNNTSILSLKEIGAKYGKSSESIRSNLFSYPNRPDLTDLFKRNMTCYGVRVNSELIQKSSLLFESYLYSVKFLNQFVLNDKSLSITQVRRLIEAFDFSLEEIVFDDSDYSFYTILRKDEMLEYKAHFRVLNSILRNGLKLSKEVLIQTMRNAIKELPIKPNNKKIKENGLNLRMFEVILQENFKLELIEEGEEQLYQFKWQYLSSQIDKTTRILFENGGVMSKSDIFEEFQNRENELGIVQSIKSLDFLNIRATDKIHPQGGNGYWFYDENYTQEINNLAQRVNEDIITIFNGKVNLDKFIEYTKKIDFYQTYAVSSIKTNVLLCSKESLKEPKQYIHNDFKEIYPEIEVKSNRNKYLSNTIINLLPKILKEEPKEKNELVQLIDSELFKLGIEVKTKNNINQNLDKFCDLGILSKIEIDSKFHYQFNEEVFVEMDLTRIGKKQEPLYKTNIRAKAITYLKDHSKVKLSEVFELVKELAPAENAKTNIYKIFNDTSLFIKETIDKEVWVSLDTPYLPVPQEMHVDVSEDSTEVLGINPIQVRQLFDTTVLKKAIIDELITEKNIYGLNQEIIFETFDSFIEIVLKNERNSHWGRTLVQSIYENFCTKTDIFDRQICVMNLVGSYETFLKHISPLSDVGRVSGIVEIINSMPEVSDLYNYKNQAKFLRDNKQKDNFSYIINKTKYYADLYRHDRSHDDLVMGNSKMMKSIVDFTALYLYTLYLVDSF